MPFLGGLETVSQKKFPKKGGGKPAGLPRRPGRDVATFSEIFFKKLYNPFRGKIVSLLTSAPTVFFSIPSGVVRASEILQRNFDD